MKYLKYILVLSVLLVSCEDFLDPKISEDRSYDQLIIQPTMVKGMVSFAYRSVPGSWDNINGDYLDCATDNAVTNNISGVISRTAESGSFWSANRGPFWNWNTRYEEIMNLNKYFEIMRNHDILFTQTGEYNDSLFKSTISGEAHFLRAWCYFDLLRVYGGKDVSGEMKGVPIVTKFIDPQDFLEIPRAGFNETVAQILLDLDSAMIFLPTAWNQYSDNKYENTSNWGRPTDAACLMLKSRVLLYAASPAYTDGLAAGDIEQKWTDAAIAASEAIDLIGFDLPDLYLDTVPEQNDLILRSLYNDPQNDELILRRITGSVDGERGLETWHAIPTRYGSGYCNPTQNLVDAFPMSNGYPISDIANSGYDEDNMYVSRDPRFYQTILYNGATFAYDYVETFVGGKDLAGGSVLANVTNSTRTGYYLRKGLSEKVNLASGQEVSDYHYAAMFRKVELLLNFAEAANEAVGPSTAIGGRTAEEALTEVRRRAGIADGSGNDPFLTSQAGNADDFRSLIKNERRIELAFEGQRFFDLRRWKDPLGVPVYKINILKDGFESYSYEKVKLLDLAYDNTKFYNPIPQSELNKTDQLTQNEKW